MPLPSLNKVITYLLITYKREEIKKVLTPLNTPPHVEVGRQASPVDTSPPIKGIRSMN